MTATTTEFDETLSALQAICREVFEDPSLAITAETTAEDVPNWDSFAHLNIVVAAEQRFGVRFRTSEVEGLRNVGDFINLILARKQH